MSDKVYPVVNRRFYYGAQKLGVKILNEKEFISIVNR